MDAAHRYRTLIVMWWTVALLAGTLMAAPPALHARDATSGDRAKAWSSEFFGPGLDGSVFDTVVWDDGEGPALYVAGDFTSVGGEVANNIARWDGEAWTVLEGPQGIGTSGSVSTLAVYQGQLVAGGMFGSAGGVAVNRIGVWDGSAWSSLEGAGSGATMDGGVTALLEWDGDLYAGGGFTAIDGTEVNHVARWDGSEWSALADGDQNGVAHVSPPLTAGVNALAVYEDELIVAGRFTHAGAHEDVGSIASWDGAGWSALRAGVGGMPVSTVGDLEVFNRLLVAGGQFTTADGAEAGNIAQWDGSAWAPLNEDDTAPLNGSVSVLTQNDDELVVAGSFSEADGQPVNRITRWDSTSWAPLEGPDGVGVDAFVNAVAVHQGKVIAGGGFREAGGVRAGRIAAWDSAGWTPLDREPGTGLNTDVGSTGNGLSLEEVDGDIVVAGNFTHAGDVEANRIARWDGGSWSSLGSGFNAAVYETYQHKGDLIAGGAFVDAGDQTVNRIAWWDGDGWQPLVSDGGIGVGGAVRAMTSFGGELVVGGQFTQAGGESAGRIARWDGADWDSLSGHDGEGADSTVWALSVHDGDLLAGGAFSEIGGISAGRAARWDGATWSPLHDPESSGFNNTVEGFAEHDGDLLAYGAFTEVDGIEAAHVARWNGGAWEPFAEGMEHEPNGAVEAAAVFDGDLVIAGRFTEIGLDPIRYIARWDGTGWVPLTGPRGSGTDDSIADLLVTDGGDALAAAGYFLTTGGVSNWGIGLYSDTTLSVSGPVVFDPVLQGTTSPPETMTLTNHGDAPLEVTQLHLPEGPFALGSSGCGETPFTIAPAAACELEVTFTPAEHGAVTTDLAVHGDAPGSPLRVQLEGVGLPAEPMVTVSPDKIDEQLPVGTVGNVEVTLANDGTAPLEWDLHSAELDDVTAGDGRTSKSQPSTMDTFWGVDTAASENREDEIPLGSFPKPHAGTPERQRGGPRATSDDRIVLSHSASDEILRDNTVACMSGGVVDPTTVRNHFFRSFELGEFGITDGFDVTEVTFGVQLLTTPAPVTVNLYQLAAKDELLFENLELVGTATPYLLRQQMTHITVPITGTVPADATLVVELLPPDLTGTGRFFPGSNQEGESAASYVAAPTCEPPAVEPTPYDEITSDPVHLVMAAVGHPAIDCTLPEWLDAAARSGSVAAGDSEPLEFTIDARELAVGVIETDICLYTDDPKQPRVSLPVSVTVTDDQDPGPAPTPSPTATPTPTPDPSPSPTPGPSPSPSPSPTPDPSPSPTPDPSPSPEPEPGSEGLVRLAGDGRVETAIAISNDQFDDGEADAVVLARADEYPDALTAAPLATAHNAPLLLTSSDQLISHVAEEITRVLGGRGDVHLVGGTAALDAYVEQQVRDLGYPTSRHGGPTRFETAGVIAKELDDPAHALITTGLDFPDALTAGAAAAANNGVVLLSSGEAAHPVTDDYLEHFNSTPWAVGGPAADAYPDAEPLVGPTRDETAIAVAQALFPSSETFAVARRDDYPDALAGSVHSATSHGPLLLAYTDAVPTETATWLEDQTDLTNGTVYGGTTAINDHTFSQIELHAFE